MTRDETITRLLEILPDPRANDRELTQIFYEAFERGGLSEVDDIMSELWGIDLELGETWNLWTLDLRVSHNARELR